MRSKRLGRETGSAGAAWVERYLLPRLEARFSPGRSISCLQIAPLDETEAHRLREAGHTCDIGETKKRLELPLPDSHYDFVFTGRFPVLAPDDESRVVLAKEMHRVLRPGGSLLLAMGNRRCPIDLTKNGPLIHGARSPTSLSFDESRHILVQKAEFTELIPQNVFGHFGWGSIPPSLWWFGGLLDAYWRFIATPNRHWLYASPLNPTFILWLNKD